MDALVDLSAELPRKFGFAPTNDEIYPNDAARKEARFKKLIFYNHYETRLGVDFTNILLAAFTHTDPKSEKRQSSYR